MNLKGLNHFVEYQNFKMEGVPMLGDFIKSKDFLTKVDLRDGYLTVPISIPHPKFLRFIWRDTLWEFSCLPFGLRSAPRVFTKLLKPVVAQLRNMGIRLIIYVDDIRIMSETKELAEKHSTLSVSLLSSLGFVIKEDKLVFNPTQDPEFLVFLVNSVTMSLYLPSDVIKYVKRDCPILLDNNLVVSEFCLV